MPTKQYLSDKEITERYSIARATVWRWVAEGRFPSPVKIGNNCTRWKIADLEQWEAKMEGAK